MFKGKDKDLIELGKALRKRRIDKDVSRKFISENTGLSVQYIGEIERGIRNPTILSLVRIAKAMKEEQIIINISSS